MTLFLLKLLVTPLLIALVTWVGRAYGPRAGGLVTGLPLTSGPISLFLLAEHGAPFVTRSAVGTVAGTIGVAAFCGGYGWASRRLGWPLALGAGAAAFGIAAVVLQWRPLGLGAAAVVAAASSAVIVAGASRVPAALPSTRPIARDLPLRMLVATAIVAGVTLLGRFVGPGLCGVLSAIPAMTAVLVVFTHRADGTRGALALLAGVATGSIGAQVFFLVVAGLLGALGGAAYAVAAFAAIAVNVVLAQRTAVASASMREGTS